MTDTCAICSGIFDIDQGVMISRCCCWSDYVCTDCLRTKSLADYVGKAV